MRWAWLQRVVQLGPRLQGGYNRDVMKRRGAALRWRAEERRGELERSGAMDRR